MAIGILTGGEALFRSAQDGAGSRTPRGVFSDHPGATLKHSWNRGGRRSERVESMARLFIELRPGELDVLLSTIPPETRPLARVLAGNGYIDFLLEAAQESFREKTQIVDTLTDNYVAFYSGQEAPLFMYRGRLLNTFQDDQRVWFLQLYRDILRGSRLAHRNLIARLRYDSFIVSGYLENLDISLTSDMQMAGSFGFNLRAKHMTVFTPNLARPTVLQTPATTNTLFESSVTSPDETARTATLAPEQPPTTTKLAAADTTDEEIDPRESELTPEQRELLEFRQASLNSQSVSNDGVGGISNVLGAVGQVAARLGGLYELSRPRNLGLRIRGLQRR